MKLACTFTLSHHSNEVPCSASLPTRRTSHKSTKTWLIAVVHLQRHRVGAERVYLCRLRCCFYWRLRNLARRDVSLCTRATMFPATRCSDRDALQSRTRLVVSPYCVVESKVGRVQADISLSKGKRPLGNCEQGCMHGLVCLMVKANNSRCMMTRCCADAKRSWVLCLLVQLLRK